MRRYLRVSGWLLLAALGTFSRACAKSPNTREPAPPSQDSKTDTTLAEFKRKAKKCFRSGCHTDLTESASVHGPVDAGLCDGCHIPGEGEHAWKLARSDKALCTFCHELELKRLMHKPVEEKDCMKCHDPHHSEAKGLLLEEEAELCADCHQLPEAVCSHGPVLGGDCRVCHAVHGSDEPGLLKARQVELCFGCHTEFEESVAKQFVHGPVRQDCEACHAAHGSPLPMLLREPAANLCVGCHDDILTAIEDGGVPLGARDGFRDCATCHESHASSFPALLVGRGEGGCLSCHDRNQEAKGKTLANIGDIVSITGGHGTACAGCHWAHGSYSEHGALTGRVPRGLYAKFEVEAYSLCFGCHPQDLVTAKTTAATRFRDGEKNLHRVHVVRPRRPRTCNVCHEVHGSQLHALLRTEVPYGRRKWPLRIGFEKLPQGGKCDSSCHPPVKYLPGPQNPEPRKNQDALAESQHAR